MPRATSNETPRHAHVGGAFRGQYVLAISSANRVPAVFGGAARSVRRAREFDPLGRSDEELSKILSWNGVQGAVEAGTAPRGCPGYVDCPLV